MQIHDDDDDDDDDNSFLHLLVNNCDFLNTDISQGSVATRLGYRGVFKYDLVKNFSKKF